MAAKPATRTTSTGIGWLSVPRDWTASLGDIIRFCGQSFGDIFNGRVFRFFGEALRQAGILILGSALVIWGMVFILGLECGIEGAYFTRSTGAPAYSGVFTAWCDLRDHPGGEPCDLAERRDPVLGDAEPGVAHQSLAVT